jgi:hypothetical protein
MGYIYYILVSTKKKTLNDRPNAQDREGNLPISSPSIFTSMRRRLSSSPFKGDGARPELDCVSLPKRTEAGLVVRSNTTLQAPLSPYIAPTAKVAGEETWSSVKPIQRTTLKGKIVMQYTIGYLGSYQHWSMMQMKCTTYASITNDRRLTTLSWGSAFKSAFWKVNFHQVRSFIKMLPRLQR